MSEKIVQLNEAVIKKELKELVRGSVEETLNELLEAEAEKLTQSARYERNEQRLYGQNVPLSMLVHPAGYRHCHTYNSSVKTNLFVQGIHPQNRVAFFRGRSNSESIHLFVQTLCHRTNLAARNVLNSQTFGQFLYFAGGYTLHKSLLYHLDQRCLTALALCYKKRYVTALSHLWNYEVHGTYPGIQPAGTVAATISAAAVVQFAFLCSHLLAAIPTTPQIYP